MINWTQARSRHLGARDIVVALGALLLWVFVAMLVSGVLHIWVSRRLAGIIGHFVGVTVFGLLMKRLVFSRASSGKRAI